MILNLIIVGVLIWCGDGDVIVYFFLFVGIRWPLSYVFSVGVRISE